MIERARWRPNDVSSTPLATHYGRELLLGLPVGLWVVVYATVVTIVALNLPGDFGGFFCTALFLPLMRTDRKDYDIPVRRSALPPTKNPLERLSRFFVVPLEEESSLVSLEPQPSPGPCFYVEISLKRGSRPTGGDLGVVAFSEGWLVYESRNTAFALSPKDVTRAEREKSGWTLSLSENQTLCIALGANAEWEQEMRRWLDGPLPEGLSRLPPLVANHVRRLRLAGRLHVGACLAAGAGLGGLILNLLRHQPLAPSLSGVAGLAFVLFVAGLVSGWASSRNRPATS